MAMAVPKGKSRAHGTAPGGACDPGLPTTKRARTHAQTPALPDDESEHERAEMEDDIAPEELQARMELSAKKRAAKTPVFGRTKRNSTHAASVRRKPEVALDILHQKRYGSTPPA